MDDLGLPRAAELSADQIERVREQVGDGPPPRARPRARLAGFEPTLNGKQMAS